MSFDRKCAGYVEVVDPDNPSEQDPITGMLNLNDKMLLIYKTKSIYEVLMASQLDPENKHPETRHSYQKLYSVGSSNFYLARMIIQFNEVIEQLEILRPKNINLLELKKYIWDANVLLLECEKSLYSIYDKTMTLLKKCDDIVEQNKSKNYIPTLPQIEGLNEHCFSFFSNGKKFLINAYGLLEKFYSKPNHGSNFQKSLDWSRKNLGEEHPIFRMLADDKEWVRLLAESRNAIEHPKEGQTVKFEGFKLRAGNKFSSPTWSYNLIGVGLDCREDISLIDDLNIFLGNMLTLYEELLLLCINDISGFKDIFAITEIPADKIDKNKPIKYCILAKADWLSGLKKLNKKP